jgi:hypothetical protein
MKYTSTDCFINGLSAKTPQKRFVNTSSKEEKDAFKKGTGNPLANPTRIRNSIEDESIFVHDIPIRRKSWLPKGIRPLITTTGSHQRTCIFGTLTMDDKHLFRQYDMFN